MDLLEKKPKQKKTQQNTKTHPTLLQINFKSVWTNFIWLNQCSPIIAKPMK